MNIHFPIDIAVEGVGKSLNKVVELVTTNSNADKKENNHSSDEPNVMPLIGEYFRKGCENYGEFLDNYNKSLELELLKPNRNNLLDDLLLENSKELKNLSEEDSEVKEILLKTQARVHYVLTLSESISTTPADESMLILSKEIDDLFDMACKGEDFSVPYSLVLVQRKISYALQQSSLSSVRLNDLYLPCHPLEAELLDIIDGKRPAPEKYIPRHPLGAEGFFRKHYKKFIDAGVIYQDYLGGIDPTLLQALRNAWKTTPAIKNLLPPDSERGLKERELLISSPIVIEKAHRVMTLKNSIRQSKSL